MTTPFKMGKDSAGAVVVNDAQMNFSTSVYNNDLVASTLYSVEVPNFCDVAFFNFTNGKNLWVSETEFNIPSGNFILLEDGTNLLLEDNSEFLLETTAIVGTGMPELHSQPFSKTLLPGQMIYFMTEDAGTKISISFYDQHSLSSQS